MNSNMETLTVEAMMFMYACKHLGLSQRGMAMRLKISLKRLTDIFCTDHPDKKQGVTFFCPPSWNRRGISSIASGRYD
jgi:hypothetical protein